MRNVLVIGIGPGGLEQITLQAVGAMQQVDVFFIFQKRSAVDDLHHIRDEMLRRHAKPGHRVVTIDDPVRQRGLKRDAYVAAVEEWHQARADAMGAALAAELGEDGVGALLVWGDPSLYDSTMRILDRVRVDGRVSFDCTVIPGVTSAAALAASHRMALHDIGEPVTVTTGRRLGEAIAAGVPNVVVMLDGELAFEQVDENAEIFWGAYLGTPDEVTIAGRVGDVRPEIHGTRATLREEKGWIMDIYLLRAPTPS